MDTMVSDEVLQECLINTYHLKQRSLRCYDIAHVLSTLVCAENTVTKEIYRPILPSHELHGEVQLLVSVEVVFYISTLCVQITLDACLYMWSDSLTGKDHTPTTAAPWKLEHASLAMRRRVRRVEMHVSAHEHAAPILLQQLPYIVTGKGTVREFAHVVEPIVSRQFIECDAHFCVAIAGTTAPSPRALVPETRKGHQVLLHTLNTDRGNVGSYIHSQGHVIRGIEQGRYHVLLFFVLEPFAVKMLTSITFCYLFVWSYKDIYLTLERESKPTLNNKEYLY